MAAKFDIKAKAIAHGEKIVLGIVLLLVAWFIYGARWSSYEHSPSDFTDKLSQGRAALDANVWSDTQTEEHTLASEEYPAEIVKAALNQEFDVSDFQLSTTFRKDPWGRQEPLKLLATADPERLIADPGYVFVELPADEVESEEGESEEGEEEAPSAEEDLPDEFRPVASGDAASSGTSGAASSNPSMAAMYSEYESMQRAGVSGGGGAGPTATESGASSYADLYGYGSSGLNGEGGVATQVALNRNGRLHPYIAVRAVFNVRDQIRKIQEATHLDPLAAAGALQLLDFELQRRTEIEQGLWSEWEPVQIQVAKDILEEVKFHNADVVLSSVTDPHITMPLPGRIFGAWSSHANHPDLEEYTLTPEQLQREIELNARLLDKYIEERGSLDSAIRRDEGGFSDMSLNTRQMQSEMMGGTSDGGGYGMAAQVQQMQQMMSQSMSRMSPSGQQGRSTTQTPANSEFLNELIEAEGDEERQEMLKEWILERATSDGQLLLFRYIDFEVRPGETYQYRVRIEVENPNFGRRPSEAGGLNEVVETESVWTDWSNETPATRLEPMVHYYLANIDPARGTRTDLPTPRLAFYQRSQTLGSMVFNSGVPVQIGGMVGGTQETEQYDVAKAVYTAADGDDADFAFSSDDFLVCALPDVTLNRSEHTDLRPPSGAAGALKLTEAAVVVDNDGELRMIDPVSSAAESRRLATFYRQQSEAEPFKSMREQVANADAEGPFSGEEGGYGSSYGYGSMMGSGGYGQQSDNRRIRRGGSGGGPPGMGGMSRPPAMSRPPGAGGPSGGSRPPSRPPGS